jgi:F-type H+-transporting ATPase subunit b
MEKLGIEPKLLLAQLINFAIIVVVLNKLLYKPILDMIAKRKKEIAEGVAITEKMRVEEEKFKEKQEKAMDKARSDAVAIIEEAKKQAKEVEKELVAQAHTQAAAVITRAKAEAVEIEKEAQASLRKQSVELAVTMSKRLLSSIMNAKEQHAFIEKRVKDLNKWAEQL